MISLTCDGCEERFEVDDAAAGSTVRCPRCSAANGVPSMPAGATAPGTGTSVPTARGGAIPGEERLLYLRPAMFRARPGRFTLLGLIALAGLGFAGYLLATTNDRVGPLLCAIGSLLGIVPLILWKFKSLDSSLEITSRRSVCYRGLFSKTTTEVRHEDIKNFQIDQTFQQRLFNVGSIGISSSGQDDIEIRVRDIPRPYRVREIIDRHRRR
ncbi:MAG: PH domain-containing protein [Phycisphaerales bacterium]